MKSSNGSTWSNYPFRFKGRPFPLKLMALGLLVFSILNWMRVGTSISSSHLVVQYASAPLPLYWIITGILWGIIGVVALVSLWLRRTWSLWLIGIGTACFTIWFWLDRAFLQVNPDRWRNWLMNLIINVLILIFNYSTIVYLHPARQRKMEDSLK